MKNKIEQMIDDGMRNIKPFPHLVQKAIGLIDSGDLDNHHLASIIKQDPILSARILSLANSPFYGLSRKVKDIESSCVVLGLNVIKNILVSAGALECFPVTEQRMKIWTHSIEVASISELLARKLEQSETILYTAGLLHDVGKFLLLDFFPEYQSEIESSNYVNAKYSLDDETEKMGINHTHAGGEIIGVWNLPDEIHDIVENHHSPNESKNYPMCSLLNLADEICHQIEAEISDDEILKGLRHENIDFLGLDLNELNNLLPEIREKIDSLDGVVSKFQ